MFSKSRLRPLDVLGGQLVLIGQHPRRPDQVATVFAGADVEATDRARSYFAPYPPSSPSIGLLRDGTLLFMLQRKDIENRDARAIAERLTAAFDQFCASPANK